MRDWRDGCGVSIGTGQTGGNLDRIFYVKNRIKKRILLVWDAPQTVLAEN